MALRLDDFNFDSSLTEGDKKSKFSESKKITADIGDRHGSKIDDMESTKIPPSERVTTSNVENLGSSLDNCDTMRDNPPEKSTASGQIVVPHGVRNTSERTTTTRAERSDQQSQPLEKAVSTEPCSQHAIRDVSVKSVSAKNSTRDTVTELQAEVGLPNTRFNNVSGGEKNVDTEMILDSVPNHEDEKMKNPSPLHMEEPQINNSQRNKLASSNHVPFDSTSGSEPSQSDLDLEDTSTTRASRRMLLDAKASRQNQNLTSKLPLATLSKSNNE